MSRCRYASSAADLVVVHPDGRRERIVEAEPSLCGWAEDAAPAQLIGMPRWLQRAALAGHLMQPADCDGCPCFAPIEGRTKKESQSMFKIASNPCFSHIVRVMTPADGGHVEETMRVTFRVLAVERMQSFDLRSEDGTREFLRAAIERIDDLVGEDSKTPVTYSDLVRDALLDLPYVRLALSNAYFAAVTKAAVGN